MSKTIKVDFGMNIKMRGYTYIYVNKGRGSGIGGQDDI
jgi:hypothetical protein